jgi:LysM repeat protein
MSYAVFFQRGDTLARLPTNPEKITLTLTLASEKYVVLGLGQIVIPTDAELSEYTFDDVEFPHSTRSYTETNGDFKGPDYYQNLFSVWMKNKDPVRFIAHNGITKDYNSLVILESVTREENAGEEGDEYFSFKLLEYKDFGKKSVVTTTTSSGTTTAKAASVVATTKSSKAKSTYTVQSGDTLWAIAKKYYGDGSKYSTIYNANKTILKNPNLVYTGQVLTIP